VNKDLWVKILDKVREIESKKIKLKWTHVFGHNGEVWNERCDEIARGLAAGQEVGLRKGVKY
jgi:ribonuclease HI